jgi:polyhydroxybutyrate depolymerase
MTILAPLNGGRIFQRSYQTLTSGGVKRKYLLYVPRSYNPKKTIPLVISMHGFKDYPDRQMRKSGWNRLAEKEGFIVAYPLGSGMPPAWKLYDYKNPAANPTPDIHFISDLIDHLQTHYAIDPARIYTNGLSNGGGMSLALACTLSDRIAAIGSVVGAYFYPLEKCHQKRAVPMIAFHGLADKLVSYYGGPSERFDYPFPSIPRLIKEIADHNGCKSKPIEREVNSRVHFTGYSGSADVVLYTIKDGEHAWPVGNRLPRWLASNASTAIDATSVMWEFFKEHSLK